MKQILIYTKAGCPYCQRAKELLQKKKVTFKEIVINDDPQKRQEMITKSNRHTVPQIFINNHHIGGCDDLYDLDNQGKLDQLLKDN